MVSVSLSRSPLAAYMALFTSARKCKPITSSVKLCPADIAAIAAVALFICYVVWGIPLTIRAIRSIYAKVLVRRKTCDIHVYLTDDLEKGAENPDVKSPVDRYLSPTNRFRSFIFVGGTVAHPEPVYLPETESVEQKERERLDSFKFPRASMIAMLFSPSRFSAFDMRESRPTSSVSGFYHPPSKLTVSESDEPLSPASACFPTPPGLASPSTFGSPGLNAAERLEPLLSFPPPARLTEYPEREFKPVCKPCSW
ncbi:hypothetical protein C2E23DRAFT_829085 [Lenzites betulinus]|nr:hypothetical protein C2E23DRAFT_829085 [Lenzites betulinus]